MRVLWVKVGGLWPLDSGGRLRSFHLVRELSHHHDVTLLTTHAASDEPAALCAQLADCAQVVSFPHAAPKQGSARFACALARSWLSPLPVDLWRWRVGALRAEVSRRLWSGQVDVCVTDFLVAAPNVPRMPKVRNVLFEHNVEHVIWQRLARTERRGWRRGLLEVEARKMRGYERQACEAAALTIAVSEADRDALAALAPGARVRAIPTGVDAGYFQSSDAAPKPQGLVFTGSMDWYPNEDAMLHFIGEILPRIRAELPETSLTVVGRNPSHRLRASAAAAGVHVTGRVDDVRPLVDAAAVFVAPLRVAGGTRLKILEALSMQKPVVATRVGAEGLPLVAGEHLLLADEPAGFAEAVISLLKRPEERARLGSAGRRLVTARHSWPSVAQKLESCLAEAARCA